MTRLFFQVILATILMACGGNNASSKLQSSPTKDSIPIEVSRIETDSVKNQISAKRFETYLSSFHFYSGRRAEQKEVHRYCTPLHEDLRQCVLFDGNGKEARLAGVEYIISERLFKTLPDDEKKLWHSYRYEVKSGQLIAPDLSPKAEHDLMAELVSSYGKTWQTWQPSSDSTLPFGGPALMMGFTRDGQLDPDLLQNRDNRFKITASEKRQLRSDILGRSSVTGADSWENGPAIQLPALTKRNEPHLQKDTLH